MDSGESFAPDYAGVRMQWCDQIIVDGENGSPEAQVRN